MVSEDCDGENVTVVKITEDELFNKRHRYLPHRQRHEPLQIIDIDLGEYLKNQGCIIQKTSVDISADTSDYENFNFGESNHSKERKVSKNIVVCNADIPTEQNAKITVMNHNGLTNSSCGVTVNKGHFVDQNVGISGEVFMVPPYPKLGQKTNASSTYDEKRFPTVVYIGTLEEKESDKVIKSVDVLQTIEEDESGPSSITLSFYNNSPASVRKIPVHRKKSLEDDFTANPDSFSNENSLLSPALLLQWRVRPPEEEVQSEDRNSPITPTSSMFSSAYTVTELSSDNSSDGSPTSESTNSTISSRRTSDVDCGDNRRSDCYVKFQEYLHLFRQLSSFSKTLELENLDDNIEIDYRSSENENLIGSSCNGSNRYVEFNYIPSREQREKEEEELWVANDAAYYNQDEESTSVSSLHEIENPYVLNLVLNQKLQESPENEIIKCNRNTKEQQQQTRIEMTSSATQTVYSCLMPPAINYFSPKCTRRQGVLAERAAVGARLLSVKNETASREEQHSEGSRMATLLCSVNTSERRHYSTRQRLVEPEATKVPQDVKSAQCFVPENADKSKETKSTCSIKSVTTNKPTKRFSFLIRSNSMERGEIVKLNANISASDKAILARLAELKLEDIKENVSVKKCPPPISLHPSCRRCQEPVYPREQIQPSRDMLFHTSCFKCCQCGARLNLKTFYRNPLTLRDYRIYCKNHVPSLDPGRVTLEKKTKAGSAATTSCRAGAAAVQTPSSTSGPERVVVKGDTQGLRYF